MWSARRYLIGHIVPLLPATRAYWLKARLWRFCGIDVATSARLVSSVSFQTNGGIEIGERTFLGHDVMFVSGNAKIIIGNDVDVAPRVVFAAGTHEIDMIASRTAGRGLSRPITVQDGAWIGANSTILGGVIIGRKSVVAAGSVVTSDIPPCCVAAGVPCRVLKRWNPDKGNFDRLDRV